MSDFPTLALSLIQPWAWVVCHGPKDIENRVWWTEIRGPLWIAASAQVTRRYYDQAREIIECLAPGLKVPPLDELDYGCIVGRAKITDCILPGGYRGTTAAQARDALHLLRLGRPAKLERHPRHPARWHFHEQYGYALDERVALAKTVPCKGHQRWWRVPADVLQVLRSTCAHCGDTEDVHDGICLSCVVEQSPIGPGTRRRS